MAEKKHKHAPREESSKKPVSKVREIPGLETKKQQNDIRFDSAFGKVDEDKVLQNYSFLNKYRQNELADLIKMSRDKKLTSKMDEEQLDELNLKISRLRSRLDVIKNREIEAKVVKDYGKQHHGRFLNHRDKQKLVNMKKYETLSGKQREKVIERKRKRKLGKEMKRFGFDK
ncbi:unnamed protein product [Kuraishia capsulata CBS 1993]|uniref:rRNA biogenesis protein RRP36 n=1 Tax=Kuraishia capsulata CBS 1993 TaxID=1382522 RepID=W6MU43_9ASCO|nr:uncharacterized protein KUCA_T00004847001 [Kuraishia capsulata CBS 1993]CDK28862.1 unnamed protein product [Kuraishia capsulata CBS 1993]